MARFAVLLTGLVATSSMPLIVAHASPPALILRVSDSVGVPQHYMNTARQVAQATFQEAEIGTEWRECPLGATGLPSACNASLQSTEVVVRIVVSPAASSKPRRSGHVLGFSYVTSAEASVLATVFFDQVQRMAARAAIDPGTLLGRALTHEVGHLLFGTTDHTATGLMRSQWTDSELRQPLGWSFSAWDKQQIEKALMARFTRASPPVLLAERARP